MLWVGVYLLPPPPRHVVKVKIISCCASIFFFFSLVALVFVTCVLRQGAATNKFPAPISLYGLSLGYVYNFIKNPHIYQYQLQGSPKIEKSEYQNIILIVDESVRWDYSPFLRIRKYKKWNVFDYGRATSYANASATSNILLRKGARFESLSSDFYNNPLIWDYAKKAGYATYLYDNQGGGVGHDYFDTQERQMIDFNISNSVFRDADIWKQLSYLNGNQRTFTLIIKRGSHFPYRDFPEDLKINFVLSKYQNATFLRKKYLKSVVFQSDDFWREFFDFDIRKPTLVIYTSDHGQNLEDVEGLTHGTSGKEPYVGEGLVPLVVLTNIKDNFAQSFEKNLNRVSHFNIFPTLIESMGYSQVDLGYQNKNTSLRNAVTPIKGFFYGIPFGYFGKAPDFIVLDGLNYVKK